MRISIGSSLYYRSPVSASVIIIGPLQWGRIAGCPECLRFSAHFTISNPMI